MSGKRAANLEVNPTDVFISYASRDLTRAAALHEQLAAAGFEVWFDRLRLDPGCDWHKEIEAGCEAARVIVPLMTPHWQTSEWTKYETYVSDAIIPVLAEGDPEAVLPPPLRRLQVHMLDPLASDDATWQKLFAALRRELAKPAPRRSPRILDLPYAANPFFTGRDVDLVRIHEELHEAPVAALTQGRVRALAAMGGVGKTTLANEYARRFWRLYPQILWVDARSGLESGFALMFEKLCPDRANEDLKQDDRARLALAELSGPRERLLVLDNVEDAKSVRPFLPRTGTGCRTLITSRFADWPVAEGIRAVALDVLEPESARDFLAARTGQAAEGDESAACDALAKALGYLPLALEQAGAYIAAPGAGVGFAAYLRLYEAATADLLARKALGSTRYPDAVITTWQTTVAKLSPESRAVLRLCAWYADTPISRVLVMKGAMKVLAQAERFGPVSSLSGPAAAELRMRDALKQLWDYSMILDVTDTTFRVHGLVQAVERVRAEEEGHSDEARGLALVCLSEVFPYVFNDPSTWPLCRVLLPHQRALVRLLPLEEAAADLATLLHKTGGFLIGTGNAAGALPLYRRALDSRERVLGLGHPDTLDSVNSLAWCIRTLGDAAGALPIYRRALDGRERVLGSKHPATLASVNNLGECMLPLGDAAGALPLFRRAVDSCERVLGSEHPQTVASVSNLARCLQALGNCAEALPFYRRALDISERVLGSEHPQTLISVMVLAQCMLTLGDATGALPLFRRALDGNERVLGSENPDTLASVNDLAACMQALGDAAGALPLVHRALHGSERLLGAEHPTTFTVMNNLAQCLLTLGDAAGALPLYRRALDGRERVLGAEHPDTLNSVDNLVECLDALGDAAGALPLLRRALATREHALGTEHPDTLNSVDSLAGCLVALGDAAGALPLLRRVLATRERLLGKEHPDTLARVTNLAYCLSELGDSAGALPLFRRALESGERVFGAEHPYTLTSLNDWAGMLLARGDPAGALPLLRRVMAARERLLGADHPHTLISVGNLAQCLQIMGESDAGAPLHRRALETSERVLGADDPRTLVYRRNYEVARLAAKRPRAQTTKPWWRSLFG